MTNKLSLSSIFGIIVTTIGALLGLFLVEVMKDIHTDHYKNEELLVLTSIFAGMSLFIITGIGLMFKMRWARIIVLSILYFSLVVLTIVMIIVFFIDGVSRFEQMIVTTGMSVFAYTFLICSIILFNHQIVKKEFGIS